MNPQSQSASAQPTGQDAHDGWAGRIHFIGTGRFRAVRGANPKGYCRPERDETQKAADELEDCNVRAQNEYETKSNAIGTTALLPMMRVYAQNRLKQNLDAELRACRSQYESLLKAVEAEQ